MAYASDSWPTVHVDEQPPKSSLNYAMTSNEIEDKITTSILINDITNIHGEPTALWEEEENDLRRFIVCHNWKKLLVAGQH